MTHLLTDVEGTTNKSVGDIPPEETLFMVFKNRFVVDVYHSSLEYWPLYSGKVFEGSIMSITPLDFMYRYNLIGPRSMKEVRPSSENVCRHIINVASESDGPVYRSRYTVRSMLEP